MTDQGDMVWFCAGAKDTEGMSRKTPGSRLFSYQLLFQGQLSSEIQQ